MATHSLTWGGGNDNTPALIELELLSLVNWEVGLSAKKLWHREEGKNRESCKRVIRGSVIRTERRQGWGGKRQREEGSWSSEREWEEERAGIGGSAVQ